MNDTIITWGILGLAILWFVYQNWMPVKGMRNLSARKFQEEMGKANKRMIVDVREPFEFQSGHIAGAVNIPLSRLKERYAEIPPDTNVFLYCRSGMRSKKAGRFLSRKGYRRLFNLQGGIAAWQGRTVKS